MGFRLKQNEIPAEGYRRILLEQVSTIMRELAKSEENRVEAVHNARRHCKRVRAVLRLLRRHIPDFSREENGVFREIARGLSPYRDADVRLATFGALREDLGEDANERFAGLREFLATRPDASAPWAFETSSSRALVTATAARERLKNLELPRGADFDLVAKGLRRSYRTGRRAMKQACSQGSDAAFHEWRKRVKDLDYQLQTLRPLWPPVLKGFHKELDQLSEILGHHNDLAVLHESAATALKAGDLKKKDFQRLEEVLDQHRQSSREEAHIIGERLYAESSSAFIKRMQVYWQAWKAETEAAAKEEDAVVTS